MYNRCWIRTSWMEQGGPLSRILALDLGEKRIGMAISDELGLTAQGLPTLQRKNLKEDLRRLAEMAARWQASRIVMGNPVNMGGGEGRRSEWVRQFAVKLEKLTGLPVELWDERLTSREAERTLREAELSPARRRESVDRLAAVILLQSYLDARRQAVPQGEGG